MVVYGLVGLALAVIGVLLAIELNARIERVAAEVTGRVAAIEQTLHSTASALDKAATTTDSFAATLQQTSPALDQAVGTLSAAAGTLREASATAAGISILGEQPLVGLSGSVARTADSLDRLAGQLSGITGALATNQAALADLSVALRALSADVEAASASLEASVSRGLEAGTDILTLLVVGLAVWLAFPALAALLLGLWLLRAAAPRPLPAGAPEGTAGA